MATLSGKLPKGEGNGLELINDDLIDDPRRARVAIVIFDVSKVTTSTDTGSREATCRILRFEPVEGEDRDQAAMLARRAMEERLGQTLLPFETEQDITTALGNVHVDPNTGEVFPDDE